MVTQGCEAGLIGRHLRRRLAQSTLWAPVIHTPSCAGNVHSLPCTPKVGSHHNISSQSSILSSKLAPGLGEPPRYFSLSASPLSLWTCETKATRCLLTIHPADSGVQTSGNHCTQSRTKRGEWRHRGITEPQRPRVEQMFGVCLIGPQHGNNASGLLALPFGLLVCT